MPTAYDSQFAWHRQELLNRVAHIGFFQKLTDEERREMLSHGKIHNHNDGQVIFEEGAEGDESFFFIVNGEVAIELEGYEGEDGSNTVATLTVGEIFGEMSMFGHMPRSATARAKGPTAVLQIDLDQAIESRTERPPEDLTIKILLHITDGLCRKLRYVNKVLLHST